MRSVTIVCTAIAFASPAISEEYFGDASGCARWRGDAETSDLLYLVGDGTIERYEAKCDVESAGNIAENATRFSVYCSGEGELWDDEYVIESTDDEDVRIIYPMENPAFRTELNRCQ